MDKKSKWICTTNVFAVIELLERTDILPICIADLVEGHSEFTFEDFSSNHMMLQMIRIISTFISSFNGIFFRQICSSHESPLYQYDVFKYMNKWDLIKV